MSRAVVLFRTLHHVELALPPALARMLGSFRGTEASHGQDESEKSSFRASAALGEESLLLAQAAQSKVRKTSRL